MTADNNIITPVSAYSQAKAWIAFQEAFEAEHKTPAPLTNAQRKALEALRLPVLSSPPPPAAAAAAAALSDTGVNYVGKLIEHRQKFPAGGPLVWVEEACGVLAGGTTGRICRVTIAESLAAKSPGGPIAAFPAKGYGLVQDEKTGACKAPTFPTKKAAKHFAAKCAVDWLVAQRLMPPYEAQSGGVMTIPPVSVAAAAAAPDHPKTPEAEVVVNPATGGASLKRPNECCTNNNYNTNSPPCKKPSTPSTMDTASRKSNGGHETDRPATERVVKLCTDLGFSPPRYQYAETSLDVFDGYPHFDDYGDKELLSLKKDGAVKGVAGRENARQAMAAKLLKPLQTIWAEREALFNLAVGEENLG